MTIEPVVTQAPDGVWIAAIRVNGYLSMARESAFTQRGAERKARRMARRARKQIPWIERQRAIDSGEWSSAE